MNPKFKPGEIVAPKHSPDWYGKPYWIIQKVTKGVNTLYYYTIFPLGEEQFYRSISAEKESYWNVFSREDYPELYI